MFTRTLAIATTLSFAMATSGYALASTDNARCVDSGSQCTSDTTDTGSKDAVSKDTGKNDSRDVGSKDTGSKDVSKDTASKNDSRDSGSHDSGKSHK